uniref:RIMS-binding protein 2 n=1 Tax=Parascaris univalens TaxID=6257 RepID=A0A915AXX1_PARUN
RQRDAPVAPQHVRVWSITPVAACVSWYPSNSNAEHILLLNAVKVGVCPPSVFQVQLNGLSPSTIYRVSVRTKHPKAVLEQRPVERCVDFKTLPKIGLPDPPANVQVEMGPQPGTLLVSWTPVVTQPLPPSRAAVHSYLVYADGQNIAQVPNASADHVLLRLSDFADDPPIFITVRTRTREGAVSSDSNVSRVPRAVSLNLPSGTIPRPTPLTNLNLTAQMSAPSSLVQPLGSLTVPGAHGSAASSATGLMQTTSAAMGGITDPGALTLAQSAYTGALPIGAAQGATIIPGMQVGSLQGSGTLSRIPLAQLQGGETLVTMPVGSVGTAQGGLLANTSSLGGTFATGAVAPSTVPATDALNSYTATGVGTTLTASGKPKFGYAQSPGILIDGAVRSYQAGAALQEWKPHNQYYTFHPKLLCREVATVDDKPSVLEMEHNYLLKHRAAQQWPTMSQTTRGRLEQYVRNRCTSADEQATALRGALTGFGSRSVLPASLARVRTEELCSTRSEPDLRPMALDDYSCRWFVALFDYSHHMSPNANAQQEELSFRKHQLIKVFGEVDEDGFYTGQIGHRIGLVPSNMVIEIAKDDLLPQRRRSDALPEPSLRRMRWGSLKSRSYDHAGDRRPPYYRPAIEPEYYASSLERRDHSLPSRPNDYFTSSRRMIEARSEAAAAATSRGEPTLQRGDYMIRSEHDEPYDAYPPNGRHVRDYYAYSRDYRSREPQERERDRRDYYRDERDIRDLDVRDGREYREHREMRDAREQREMRDRDLRGEQRDLRERDYGRDMRETRYSREPSSSRREREFMEDRDEQREARDYREQREIRDAEYREMRKERDAEQMGKPYDDRGGRELAAQRSYERRDYGRVEKGQDQYHDAQYGAGVQQRYPTEVPPVEDSRYVRTNGESLPVRKMIAKFDYDSRQLSPNVDAEQVELSFHAGDVITVFGEMDEDGFYMGELNGVRGLVPSNFLQTSPPSSLMPPQMPPMQQVQQPSQPIPPITVAVPEQPRAKGVAFQESAKKGMPARQASQTSTKTPATTKGAPKTGNVNAPKSLTKKGSDVGSKTAPNARKTSQATKKADGAVKKKS